MKQQLKCIFLDKTNSSKRSIYDFAHKFSYCPKKVNFFIISTCLRFEMYFWLKEDDIKINEIVNYFSGTNYNFITEEKDAIKRLLFLSCGLLSDLMGEKEIAIQSENCIRDSYDRGNISRDQLDYLLNIVNYAYYIRYKIGIDNCENYSTIAANIVSKLNANSILIIGAGYMAKSFAKNLLNKEQVKIDCVNRNIKSIEFDKNLTVVNKVPLLDKQSYTLIQNKYDVVFCAVKNTKLKDFFDILNKTSAQILIDVSYPPIEYPKNNFNKVINLDNYDFTKNFHKIDKEKILKAINEINEFIKSLH